MQTLQGAREVLTASSYRRQSQPFISVSAGSEANETAPLVQLVCPPPSTQLPLRDQGVIVWWRGLVSTASTIV